MICFVCCWTVLTIFDVVFTVCVVWNVLMVILSLFVVIFDFFFMVVSSVLWSSWASFWSVWMAMWFFWASLWSSWVCSCFAYLCDHFEHHYGCFEKPCGYFQHLWSLWVSLWTSIASLNSFWASLRSFLSSSSWLFCVLLGSFNHLWGFLPCVCLKCPYGHSESLCVVFEHLCGFFWVSLKLFCVFCGRLVCLIVLSLQSFEHHYDCFEKLCGYFQRLCGHSEGFFWFFWASLWSFVTTVTLWNSDELLNQWTVSLCWL